MQKSDGGLGHGAKGADVNSRRRDPAREVAQKRATLLHPVGQGFRREAGGIKGTSTRPQQISKALNIRQNQICKSGRKLDDVCRLDFVAPERSLEGKIYAKIPRAEIIFNVNRWCNTLVGYVVGN